MIVYTSVSHTGDAILTMWQVDKYIDMAPTVLHVIKCALSVQKSYGEWTTSVGVKLRVKLGMYFQPNPLPYR